MKINEAAVCESALDYEWWSSIYEDAERVGLRLKSFGLDRNRHATGAFLRSAEDCARKILVGHGCACATFQTAELFLANLGNIPHDADTGECLDADALRTEE
jgi:hypothetical protein